MINYCSNCGKAVREGSKFCVNCGKKLALVQPMAEAQADSEKALTQRTQTASFCYICGKPYKATNAFCTACGAKRRSGQDDLSETNPRVAVPLS